jgi:hypothetical protein
MPSLLLAEGFFCTFTSPPAQSERDPFAICDLPFDFVVFDRRSGASERFLAVLQVRLGLTEFGG